MDSVGRLFWPAKRIGGCAVAERESEGQSITRMHVSRRERSTTVAQQPARLSRLSDVPPQLKKRFAACVPAPAFCGAA